MNQYIHKYKFIYIKIFINNYIINNYIMINTYNKRINNILETYKNTLNTNTSKIIKNNKNCNNSNVSFTREVVMKSIKGVL